MFTAHETCIGFADGLLVRFQRPRNGLILRSKKLKYSLETASFCHISRFCLSLLANEALSRLIRG